MAAKRQKCSKCQQAKALDQFPFVGGGKRPRRLKVCLDCVEKMPSPPVDQTHGDHKLDVPWDQDPEILFRLDQVATMMIEGAKTYQIAAALQYSWTTAKRDTERVHQLWAVQSGMSVNERRAAALAQWRHIQMYAWTNFRKETDHKVKPQWMQRLIDAQRQIDSIMGVHAPKQVNLGITLSPEALRALEALEAAGVARESLFAEFEGFLTDAAAEYANKEIK